jgi:hypothetical protein
MARKTTQTRIKVTQSRKSIGVGARQAIQSGIFGEMEFMRIGECWAQNNRDAGLWGGAAFDGSILRQFQLTDLPSIFLDFWFRGRPVSPPSAAAFRECLTEPHSVTPAERDKLVEVIGVIAGPQKPGTPVRWLGEIHSADVGPLQGRLILAVNWTHPKQKRRFLSVFISGDETGHVVHEIHYSTPMDIFDANLHHGHNALRSVQWRQAGPPPLSSQ